MSKSAKKILEEAEKAKAETEKSIQEKQKPKPQQQKQVKSFTTNQEERFRVHQILNGKSVGLFVLFSISLVVIPWSLWLSNIIDTSLFLYSAILCISLPILYWIYIIIEVRLKYPFFKHWRKKLPFDFIGWENLVDHPDFGWTNWQLNAVLTIELKEGNNLLPQINSLLHLFAKKASKKFYPNGFSPGPRIKWTVKDNQAIGSMNAGVTKVLYKFLKTELSTIAQKYQNIKKVTISLEGRSIYIPYQSRDID